MSSIKSTHRQATHLKCVRHLSIYGKSCEPMRVHLISLTAVLLQARDYLVSDWFFMLLWCNDSKPRRSGPQLMCIMIHLQRIFFFFFFGYNNNNRIHRRNSRFFTLSSLRHEPSPTRTLKWPGRNRVQISCNTSSAHHVQHVV